LHYEGDGEGRFVGTFTFQNKALIKDFKNYCSAALQINDTLK